MKARIPFSMNKRQKQAMEDAINKQIAEADAKYCNEVDAVVLWTLHRELGFGPTRLRRFWEALYQNHNEMVKRYEMSGEYPWICTYKLKEIGVDVEAWNKELSNTLIK